ncbi:MAG: DDE domain-containing protein [Mesorhizobium sp.]|uniref:DDE domain-containing protein n=1 Tax=Mesorhizobium mediterraneum TaxID=43617 RepID=A0AB36QZ28_9HYPH|nr:hypothetical protein CIT25_35230 [Mesorhizobium mediterraneum]RUU74725.1 DDE domain-containing protein [Mesorhizobium sp. M7A.F.Ca.MR.362.00.0.0]RWA98657.1 MAG: DDE domain-containing protein [Mesorhizobium sp.]RWB10958.1 MAG: DDE domain-containing protein [Mesorhizobium sp.]RWB36647.1 MAG: DDE domain-containing protein [Mesorhizobium sp.]
MPDSPSFQSSAPIIRWFIARVSFSSAVAGALQPKRAVTCKWPSTKLTSRIRGEWMYLYRTIESVGDTVEFWFSEHHDLLATTRFFRKALERHDRVPIALSSTAA